MSDLGWRGEPGDQWLNNTGMVAFQFICSFDNSCETCIQLHSSISESPWPVPLHDNCQCENLEIYPGDLAEEYVDYVDYVQRLVTHRRTAIIGWSNQRLIDDGVIKFDDVVTPTRIKTLAEVVKENDLTVDEMVAAGIPRSTAQRAFNASKSEIADIRQRHRDILDKLVNVAAGHANALRNAVASGVGGVPLSTPGGLVGPSVSRTTVSPTPDLPSGDDETARLLAEYLKKWPNVPDESLWWILEEETPRKKAVHANR